MFIWQAAGDSVGPFDQAYPLALQILMRSQVGKGRLRRQAVGIEVVDGQSAVVFLNQHERGACDESAVGDAQPFRNGADAVRLACAELADEGDHGTGKERLPQTLPQTARGVEVG